MAVVYKLELPRRLARFLVDAMERINERSTAGYIDAERRDARSIKKIVEQADGDYRYMPRGTTMKPCHGCGEAKRHPTDQVCDDCKRLMAAGKTALQVLRDRAAGEPKRYRVPEQAHWLPYLSHDHDDDSGRHPVQTAFHKLIFAVTEQAPDSIHHDDTAMISKPKDDRSGYSSGDVARLCRPAVREAVNDLFQKLREVLQNAYADGKNDGRRLLAGLASGELSPKDFEERSRR